jgi:hypothetical protein
MSDRQCLGTTAYLNRPSSSLMRQSPIFSVSPLLPQMRPQEMKRNFHAYKKNKHIQ